MREPKQSLTRGIAYGIERIKRLEVWTKNSTPHWKIAPSPGHDYIAFDLDTHHRQVTIMTREVAEADGFTQKRDSAKETWVTLREPAVRELYDMLGAMLNAPSEVE